MAKAKKRRTKKRQSVNRAERVAATPETLAKLRPCPLKLMLHAGRMEPEAYEAALQIKDAFDIVTRQVGYRPLDLGRIGVGHGECGARASRMISIYIAWGNELIRRLRVRPHVIVEWIEMERSLSLEAEPLLVEACELWIKTVDDVGRAQRIAAQNLDKIAA